MSSVEFDERQHDADEARREAFLPTREAALEDLVEKLMAGECYPKTGSRLALSIVMMDFLDASDLAEMIRMALFGKPGEAWIYLDECLTGHVRAYLEGDGRAWVDLRQQDMAAEAEEESRD